MSEVVRFCKKLTEAFCVIIRRKIWQRSFGRWGDGVKSLVLDNGSGGGGVVVIDVIGAGISLGCHVIFVWNLVSFYQDVNDLSW